MIRKQESESRWKGYAGTHRLKLMAGPGQAGPRICLGEWAPYLPYVAGGQMGRWRAQDRMNGPIRRRRGRA